MSMIWSRWVINRIRNVFLLMFSRFTNTSWWCQKRWQHELQEDRLLLINYKTTMTTIPLSLFTLFVFFSFVWYSTTSSFFLSIYLLVMLFYSFTVTNKPPDRIEQSLFLPIDYRFNQEADRFLLNTHRLQIPCDDQLELRRQKLKSLVEEKRGRKYGCC